MSTIRTRLCAASAGTFRHSALPIHTISSSHEELDRRVEQSGQRIDDNAVEP